MNCRPRGRARIRLCSSKSAAGSAEKPSSIGPRAFPGKQPLKSPLKIVLDTNVVLDWLVFRNPGVDALALAIEGSDVVWIGSEATRAELGHVLVHGRFSGLGGRSIGAEELMAVVDRHLQQVRQPALLPCPRYRCSDPSDQKFIDLALGQQARWLLTRDRALLKLARKVAASGLSISVPERWQPSSAGLAPT